LQNTHRVSLSLSWARIRSKQERCHSAGQTHGTVASAPRARRRLVGCQASFSDS